MKRSISVTTAAVIVLLGSLLLLGMGTVGAIALKYSDNPGIRPEAKAFAVVGFVFTLFVSFFGFATGIGLFLLKRWARILIVIAGLLLTFSGLVAGMSILLAPIPASLKGTGSFSEVKTGISIFYGFIGTVGLWWVLLFNSKKVKALFAGVESEKGLRSRPLSISVIAYLLLLGCLSVPFDLYFRWPIFMLTRVFTGWFAFGIFVILAVLQLYIGFGLLHLRTRSRVNAIYYFIFGGVNGFLFLILPGRDARAAELIQAMPRFGQLPSTLAPFPLLWTFLSTTAFILIQIYFLISRKAAFDSQPPSENPTPLT